MTTHFPKSLLLALSLTLPFASPPEARADTAHRGFTVEILIDGRPVPQYAARDTRYVEALKGKEYAIRLRNPLGVRVAVALSVDGLNTIDARRSTASTARKWVLGPYETITIGGWQTSGHQARRFYFTAEERSYAQWMGHTDDLGIISAVFFRERAPEPPAVTSMTPPRVGGTGGGAVGGRAEGAPPTPAAPAASAPAQAGRDSNAAKSGHVAQESDYAATGIGREVQHRVEQVWLDLERRPVATMNVRYEYRAQLARLGVLPVERPVDRLSRRERARGFEGYSPVPPR